MVSRDIVARNCDETHKTVQSINAGKGFVVHIADAKHIVEGVVWRRQRKQRTRKVCKVGFVDVPIINELPIAMFFFEGVLSYGITTIKELDAPKHFIYKLRDKLRSGEFTGPELLIIGPNFTTPESFLPERGIEKHCKYDHYAAQRYLAESIRCRIDRYSLQQLRVDRRKHGNL